MSIRLLALIALLPTATAAQQLTASQDIVQECFNNTPLGETRPACIRNASNECQGQKNGSTTLGIAECNQSETAHWDEILNAQYQFLRNAYTNAPTDTTDAGPDELLHDLRESQRAWIAYRDADCSFAYTRWQGGSIRTIIHTNCLMEFTAIRAFELRDMGEGYR